MTCRYEFDISWGKWYLKMLSGLSTSNYDFTFSEGMTSVAYYLGVFWAIMIWVDLLWQSGMCHILSFCLGDHDLTFHEKETFVSSILPSFSWSSPDISWEGDICNLISWYQIAISHFLRKWHLQINYRWLTVSPFIQPLLEYI